MIKKDFKKLLKKIVKKYFRGEYSESVDVLVDFSDVFKNEKLKHKENKKLQKFMLVFFLGHILDLPTLNSILLEYNLKSNNQRQQFNLLYKNLTISQLIKIFEKCFEYNILNKLQELSKKHKSCFSRELVTLIMDESVFKQWLNSFNLGEDELSFFGCFFSGQTKSTVFGFKNNCIGLVIDGIYYPLYFEYIKKGKKLEEEKYNETIKKSMKLIDRFTTFREAFEQDGIDLGVLNFTVDSGFEHKDFITYCDDRKLNYIGSPKKSNQFEIGGKKIKLTEWIEEVFLPLEKKHNENQKNLPKAKQKPFEHRFKGNYLSKNREVTLLAFRLNGSKKVSVIYCSSKETKAKTLRRHWFQRTYIEQFFKTMKHVLKIQESRTDNKDKFTFKFLRFLFMAFHVQKLVRTMQKKMKIFKNKGFITIQRIIRSDEDFKDLLQSLLIS